MAAARGEWASDLYHRPLISGLRSFVTQRIRILVVLVAAVVIAGCTSDDGGGKAGQDEATDSSEAHRVPFGTVIYQSSAEPVSASFRMGEALGRDGQVQQVPLLIVQQDSNRTNHFVIANHSSFSIFYQENVSFSASDDLVYSYTAYRFSDPWRGFNGLSPIHFGFPLESVPANLTDGAAQYSGRMLEFERGSAGECSNWTIDDGMDSVSLDSCIGQWPSKITFQGQSWQLASFAEGLNQRGPPTQYSPLEAGPEIRASSSPAEWPIDDVVRSTSGHPQVALWLDDHPDARVAELQFEKSACGLQVPTACNRPEEPDVHEYTLVWSDGSDSLRATVLGNVNAAVVRELQELAGMQVPSPWVSLDDLFARWNDICGAGRLQAFSIADNNATFALAAQPDGGESSVQMVTFYSEFNLETGLANTLTLPLECDRLSN